MNILLILSLLGFSLVMYQMVQGRKPSKGYDSKLDCSCGCDESKTGQTKRNTEPYDEKLDDCIDS